MKLSSRSCSRRSRSPRAARRLPSRREPGPVPAPTVTPAPNQPSAPVAEIPASRFTELPKNWQLLDPVADHVPGISAERAMNELLAGKAPKQTVLVAIIDNGIDTSHADLKANLWTGKDGLHGWNFIGGKDGKDVNFDTFEITREYARCHGKAAASGTPAITDAARCAEVDASYDKQRQQIEGYVAGYRGVNQNYQQILPALDTAAGLPPIDSLTPDRVRAIQPKTPQIARFRQVFLEYAADGVSPSAIADGLSRSRELNYSLVPL